MHQPIPQQGRWLRQVVTGYFNYHAVPTNSSSLTAFLFHVTNLWRRIFLAGGSACLGYHPSQLKTGPR